LSETERLVAPGIYQTLLYLKQQIKPGNLNQLKNIGVDLLNKKGFKADYVEIARAYDLITVNVWDGEEPLIILAAAYLNTVRLIDNLKHDIVIAK
ncbi:MAG: pantoate--beta-alanine ligase, partial [Ginsengibacter sp.]